MPDNRLSPQRSRLSRVLIVEDSAAELQVLSDLISEEGFEVAGCHSGKDAVEQVRSGLFSVIVVDLKLPDMDGIALVEQVYLAAPRTRIIIYTGNASFPTAKAAVNLGAFAYVEKLADAPQDLVLHLHRAVRQGFDEYADELERAIDARKLAEAALEREQRLLRHMLELHERDRRLVAFEIHDGLVQYLTGAGMRLESLASSLETSAPAAARELHTSIELVRNSVDDARRLMSGLRPPILDELGIVAAIEALLNDVRAFSGLRITFDADVGFERLAAPLETAIYRIVQEALTNVHKHSQTDWAEVTLRECQGRLQIQIRDWGCGFLPEAVADDRFGLQGIQERARLLDGSYSIETLPGQGTAVLVELPIRHTVS